MPLGRFFSLALLAVPLLFAACSESVVPEERSNPLAAAGPPGRCDDSAIRSAIGDVFSGGLETQALAKCSNVLRKIGEDDLGTALEMTLAWLEQTLDLFDAGQVSDRDGIDELFGLVFAALGFGNGTDAVVDVVTPAGKNVTTPTGFAGAEFDPNDVSDDTFIVITRLDDPRFPGDCVPGLGFDARPGVACYPLFYDYSVFPEENVVDEVVIGQCVLDPGTDPNAPADATILNRIRLATPDESGEGIVLLPVVPGPADVDCTSLGGVIAGDGWRDALWAGLGPLQRVFTVRPAFANPGKLGASISAFSPKIPVDPGASVVAGWDAQRGGFSSLGSSSTMDLARGATTGFLYGQGLETTIGQTDEVTGSALAGASIAFLGTVENNTGPIAPLTQDEQDALGAFVDNGGCAILLADNDTFGGSPDPANESLIDAFGLDVTGTLNSQRTSTATSATSAALDGFAGTVAAITHNFPGWFDGLNGATVLAELDDNGQPSAIELNSGGGRVIAFSDANQFFDSDGAGTFALTDNATLFVNSLAACLGVEAEEQGNEGEVQ